MSQPGPRRGTAVGDEWYVLQALYKALLLKKPRKTARNWQFLPKMAHLTIFRHFFPDFFKNGAVQRAVVFCVAFSDPKRLI